MPRHELTASYIFLGCSRQRDATNASRAFEMEAGNRLGQGKGGLMTPTSPFRSPQYSPTKMGSIPDLTIGPAALERAKAMDVETGVGGVGEGEIMTQTLYEAGAPLSPFHYQLRKAWRVPYLEEQIHKEFRTHIYGWTWEDPAVDVAKLGINKDDHVLAITSAGDNVLHYALAAKCERIHAVDMNPCQGHILELKLAAIQTLEYADFWQIFGEGAHERFDELLTAKLSPFLSSHAYAYWKTHADQFSKNFYFRGYSGFALRVAQAAFWLAGVSCDVKRLCLANSTGEQERIWEKRLRPVLLNQVMLKGFLGNPAFNWHALGVPRNQMNCFLEDGSVADFVKATLDPIPSLARLKDDNYFYFLCLNGKYIRSSCPAYLKPEGFKALRDAKVNNAFKLHTDTILK